MTAVDFVKRTINLDPISYRQCEELRQNSAISLSAAIRIAIRQAYVQMKKEQATNQV
jgi:hypothetical protein